MSTIEGTSPGWDHRQRLPGESIPSCILKDEYEFAWWGVWEARQGGRAGEGAEPRMSARECKFSTSKHPGGRRWAEKAQEDQSGWAVPCVLRN